MTGSSIPRLQTASLPSSACEPRRSSAIVPSFRVFSLDPLLTLSLFWYLLETVVECHYTQTSLLPHLDCVLDSTDNVCRARPPLPSLQYNLLHQKLSLLNCCIEEKRNNAHSDDLSESDDDDPIYFDQYQTPITDDSLSPNPQTPSIEPDLSPTNEVPSTETNEVPSKFLQRKQVEFLQRILTILPPSLFTHLFHTPPLSPPRLLPILLATLRRIPAPSPRFHR